MSITSSPSNGTAVVNAGNTLTYTPNAGFSGTDSFVYTITDVAAQVDSASVTVTVTPRAENDSGTTTAGVAVSVPVLANDVGTGLTITSATTPANGSAEIQGSAIEYTPNGGFTGNDSFSYTVTDGSGQTATATVAVTVAAPPNQNPVAVDDVATTFEALPVDIAVLANDSDPDGDTLTLTSTGPASNGTAQIVGALVRYTPNPGFDGVDSFPYTVSDGRGGSDTGTVTVTVQDDATPPTITAAVEPAVNANGWHDTDVTVTFECEDGESGIQSCPEPVPVTTEGGDQVVTGEAFDRAGNTAQASVTINLDKAPPSVSLSGPSTGRRGQTVMVAAPGADNLSLESVTVSVDGVDVATLTAPPFQTNVTIPSNATVGSILSVVATAQDLAGNTFSAAPLSIEVLGGGFVAGEVYDDHKGLPLAGVTVSVNAQSVTTDPRGRFGLFTTDSLVEVRAERSGFTSVERATPVGQISGTVVLDLRLTPLSETTSIGTDGGTLSTASFTLTVPPNALPAETPMSLTETSGLGLKNVLPLGWSPLGSVEVGPSGTSLVGSVLRFDSEGLTGMSLVLVRYDEVSNAWVVEAVGLTGDTFVEATLEDAGAYAFLVGDTGSTSPPPAAVGDALEGVEPVEVFFGLSAASEVTPEVSSVSPEAKATGSVVLFSPIELPSGTLVSARVEETFESFGEGTLLTEPFTQEVPLYRYPARSDGELHQEFPVAPSREFTLEELLEGRIHVEIGTAPSLMRGSLVGGEGQVVSGGDGTELTVPAGALPETVSVAVEGRDPLEVGVGFEGLTLVAAAEVELSGQTLSTLGTLSIPVSLTSSQNLFAARFLFVAGQRKLRLVGPASFADGRISTPIDTGGTYLFFQSADPLALVQGTVTEGGLPARLVLVESSTSPFMDITPDSGLYVVAAKLETTTITARSLLTGNQAVEEVTPASTATIPLDLHLSTTGPFVTEATPPNGALGVSLSPSVRVTFSEPVNPSTVTTSSLSLASTAPVPGRIILGSGNRSASFLPDGNLEPLTSYTLTASADILDTSGNLLLPFTSTFRTLDDSIPELNPDALTMSFPDGNGFVTVEAPEFSFEENAAVTIVNLTNGIVVMGNVNPNGSLSFQIQASITDELQIRVLDSSDREMVIEKTEYVGGNGQVAIGRKGGKIASGDFVVEVPEGALTSASIFTLTPVEQPVLDGLPLPQGAGGFGSGVEVNTGGAVLNEEGDLSFPVPPEAPADAQHVIVRRVVEEGLDTYQVIDTAAVVEGKVKTESPPFYGFLVSGMYLNLWVPPTPAGKNPMGAITGIAREIDSSAVQPQERPLAGVQVRVDETLQAGSYTATTDRDGRFVLFDAFFGSVGPTLNLVARDTGTPPREVRAVAFEDQRIVSRFVTLTRFSRAGEVVFNFPLTPDPPPPTEVTISLFRKNGEARVAITNGFAAVGDELILKVQFTQPPEFVNVAVNGQNVAVSRREDERVEDQTLFVFEGTFTPQEARSYTIVAEGRDAFLNLLSARKSFLAAQGGAGNEERLEGPPSIISDSAVPRNGDTGVPVAQVMSVQFTEPVTNVFPGTVLFEELGETPGPIALDILGTKVGGAVAPVTFTDEVVALTLTPQRGLKFATKYRLTFSTLIVDTDLSPTGQPDRKPLSEGTNIIEFETFRPTKLGEAPLQANLVAMTTLDNFAFVALQSPTASGSTGNLQLFDLSDPTQPTKVGDDSLFIGSMVRDVDVERDAEGGSDILGVLSFNPGSGNSGLTFFDVTSRMSPFPYAGFVTTVVPGEGADYQVDLHEDFAYVAIANGGLKIVSLSEARNLFRAKLANQKEAPIGLGAIPFDVSRGLFTRGVGFGQPATQNQVQIPDPASGATGNLRVTSIQVGGTSQDRVGYVGGVSETDYVGRFTTLNLANTPTAPIWATVQLKSPPDGEGNIVSMGPPSDVALTDIDADKYAVVVGGPMVANGRGTLAILKVTDPDTPELLTVIELRGGWGTSLAIDEDGVTVFVSTSDRKDGDATISGGVEIYNLTDPAVPLFAGSLEGFGAGSGGLSLVQGILTTATTSVGVQTATVGPAVPVVAVEKPVVLANADRETQEDIPVTYQILPSILGVTAATIEIANELGVVLFTSPVPIVERGEIIWPKGQTVIPTPTEIEFQVENPDGQESNTATGGAFVANFPSITSITPSRIVVGSPDAVLEVTGENFGPAPGVEIELPTGESLTLKPDEGGPDRLTVTLSAAHLTTLGTASLFVNRAGLRSNEFPVSVVSSIGPGTPVLNSIEPEQVVAGAGNTWITLRGSGFEDGVSFARLDGSVDPLTFERVSSEEIRALVPASFLQESGRLALQVGSLVDSFFVSEPRVLEVLPSVGAILAPLPPEIARSGIPEVPYPSPEGPDSQTVSIRGSGFQSGAKVMASVDGAEPVELATTVVSSGEIEVELSRALWSKHSTTFRLALQTAAGMRTAQTSLQNSSGPTIIVFDQNGKETGTLEPSLFHDKRLFQPGSTTNARPRDFGYLVWDTTGQRRGNRTFRDNPKAFHIEVRDPAFPDVNDVLVELHMSGGSSGATIDDRISKLKLDTLGNGVFRMKNDHRIVIVTDKEDDTASQLNDKSDGDPEDRTLLGAPGAHLAIRYLVKGSLQTQKNLGICSTRRKIRLHLVNMYPASDPVAPDIVDQNGVVVGVGVGQPQDKHILELLVKQAGEIWAAMCVDFEIVEHNGSPILRASIPNSSFMLEPDVSGYPIPNSSSVLSREALSQDLRNAIDQNLSLGPNVRSSDIRVFFIDGFVDINNRFLPTGQQVASTTKGIATAGFRFQDEIRQGNPPVTPSPSNPNPPLIPFGSLPPLRSNHAGVAFIAWRSNDPTLRANAKTLAHEIAHLVFNSPEQDPQVNVLYGFHTADPLLKKRFTEDQAAANSIFLTQP